MSDVERRAYKDDLPGSRRSPCLGCGEPVVTARHAYIQIGGRRDGSLLIEMDVEPLISQSNDPDALYGADDLYLLGRDEPPLRPEANRRRLAGPLSAGLRSRANQLSHRMIVYGLASDLSQDAELFVRLEDAQRELADALGDMPEWRDVVYLIAVDLGGSEPSVRRLPSQV